MNIRLEYSPIEGKFKQAQAAEKINTAKGYQMLCCFINSERALRFTQAVQEKYPQLNSDVGHPFPSFPVMKDELYQFVQKDVQLLEQHMNKTYERRKQLFSNRS